MEEAALSWESAANVNFIYMPDEDVNCNSLNTNVVFDVQFTSAQNYSARAFFPNTARANRNIMINVAAFAVQPPITFTGILLHELGHTLGLRHEHTRPEAGQCFEDNEWRSLTDYDSSSVMHYPNCDGSPDEALTLSVMDIRGISVLYGSPVN
jgi:hypothetical protein